MNPWRQFPLVRLIMPVCIGMASGIFLDTGIRIPLILPGMMFLGFGILVFFPKYLFPYSFRWMTGILIMMITALLSFRILLAGKDTLKKDYFGNVKHDQGFCVGEIIEPVVQKQKSTKVTVRITFMKEKDGWIRAGGKALVYIGKSRRSHLLCYGDRLAMCTRFAIPDGSRNPGGFDNRRYLERKGIFRQAYVKQDHWRLMPGGNRNPVFHMALSLRDKMLMILRNNGLEGSEFAVAGALLLGYVDEIDSDIMRDYSATGVIHILSVSGMHVGMIFLVLEKMLAFLEKRKNGGHVKAFLVIVFIWLYALITGLSPAVMRAAAMLSLVVVGKAMKRHPDILNVLAASVILLLLWQPLLLADLGFQLSYLAVAGIVLLYKPVYDLFVPDNCIVDKLWSVVAVSIAAQLATLPLCLYYFHQFPNYFMVTNIIVIPVSNLIIYTGILSLGVGNIPWISVVVAKGLSLMVWFLNEFIHWMAALPFSVSRGIAITFPEAVVLYLIMITTGVFFSGKKKMWLFVSLSLIILLSFGFLKERFRQVSESAFTVYDSRGRCLSDFTTGGKSILVGDLSVLKDTFFMETMKKRRWDTKVKALFEFQHPLPSSGKRSFAHGGYFIKRGSWIGFLGKRIVILDKPVSAKVMQKINVDYLIISGSPKVRLKDLMRHFRPGMVILDASNPPWKVKAWMKEAHWLGVRCHSVSVSGAFREEF
jgi:competence protein ComEC